MIPISWKRRFWAHFGPRRFVFGIQVKSKPSQFQFYAVFQKLIHLPLHLGQAHTSSSTLNSRSVFSQDQHKVGNCENNSRSWAQLETLLLGRDIQKNLWLQRRFTKRLKLSQQVMFYMGLSQFWEPKTIFGLPSFSVSKLSVWTIPPLRQTLVDVRQKIHSQNHSRTRPTALLRARRTWPGNFAMAMLNWSSTVRSVQQREPPDSNALKITRTLCQSDKVHWDIACKSEIIQDRCTKSKYIIIYAYVDIYRRCLRLTRAVFHWFLQRLTTCRHLVLCLLAGSLQSPQRPWRCERLPGPAMSVSMRGNQNHQSWWFGANLELICPEIRYWSQANWELNQWK